MSMRIALMFCLITSAILTASCDPSAEIDNRAADADTLQKTDEQWSEAAARKDVVAAVAFYADDAVMLPPNAPIVADQTSIRQAWAAILGPNTTSISWKASKTEVARSGELGYIYGTYQDSVQGPKGRPPIHDTGKIVEVWKKQADGNWKCIVDAYSSDLPVPTAPSAQR
jgi:ketosteroid isomerase-like protein